MPSRRVHGRAIKAGSRSYHHGLCHQGACYRSVCYQGVCHEVVCHQGGRCQGEFGILLSKWYGRLKQVKGASTLLRVQIPFMAVVTNRAVMGVRGSGLSAPHGQVRSGFTPCPAMSDLGSLNALQVDQVWLRFMLCRQIRSFAPCLLGRSGESVGRSVGWQYDAGVRSGSLQAE